MGKNKHLHLILPSEVSPTGFVHSWFFFWADHCASWCYALFALALGTDTFTVFIQGLSRVAGLSVGTVHVIVLCILMVLMLLTTKGYVKPGTIVCAFCGGPIIDFFTWCFKEYINASSGMPVRIISVLVGCAILSLGMSVVINSNVAPDRMTWLPSSSPTNSNGLNFAGYEWDVMLSL